MASEKLEVIIGLILDSGDKQKSERALSDFESSIQGIEKAVDKSNKSLKDQKQILEDLKDSMKTLREKQKEYVKGSADYNHLGKEIKTVSDRIAEQTNRVKTETLEYGKLKDQLQKVQQEEKNRLAIMNREAAMLNRMAALRAKELGDLKEKAAWIEKGARPLFALGVSSFTAITLLAKKYIDSTEETNEITQRWAASSERVQMAQMRIGKIAAEAVLPLYEKLADIAEKAADFADKNPGVIEGGLKASIVAAGLGGIGLLVSKGITLYADLKMIAVGDMQLLAAKIMADAARMQLTAATGGKVTGAGGAAATTATVGKSVATGGKVAGTAAGVAAGEAAALVVLGTIAAKLSTMIVDLVLQKTGVAKKIQDAQEKAANSGRAYPGVNPNARNQQAQTIAFTQMLAKMGIVFSDTAAKASAAAGATAANNAAVATQAQSQTMAAESANANAQASQRMSSALYITQRSSENAANSLSRFPSAISSLGSSIASFFQRIISSISGSRTRTSSTPVHDYTGYAYSRTYAMAQDGKRQFVMSGDMTRVAEKMLGGQLNQQAVLQAMQGGTTNRSVSVNGLSFSGEYTKAMRKAVKEDVYEVFTKVMKK